MRKLRILNFILLLLATKATFAQFRIENYSVGQGLAQSQVYAMLEDSRGYIWMGTRGGGVSLFDGNEFNNFNKSNGLINNYVLSFMEDKEHNIWIGTNDGISIYNGLAFKNKRVQKLKNLMISCMVQAKDGRIWLGTSNGIYSYNGKYFTHWSEKNNLFKTHIFDFHLQEDGILWACSDKGLLKISSDKTEVFTTKEGLSNNHTRSVTGDEDNIYIGTFGGGLNQYNGKEFNLISEPLLAIHDVYLLEENLWISTLDRGIVQIDKKSLKSKHIQQKDGLSNNHTKLTISDKWENLWFATSGGGVNKYYGREFECLTTDDGLKENYIYDVYRAKNGDLWTSYSDGLTRITNDTTIYYSKTNGYKGGKARVITEDNEGYIWIGTDGHSVFCFNGDEFHQFHREDGIPHYWITDIAFDKYFLEVWIATSGGICRLDAIDKQNFVYQSTTWKSELGIGSSANITCVKKDNYDRLWYGSRNKGIGYIKPGEIKTFNSTTGLKSDHIKTMETDPNGNLWIGTEGSGISIIETKKKLRFSSISTDDGLASNNTYLISFDNQGNPWIGSEQGVDKLQMDDSLHVLDVKHYNQSHGFEGVETNKNAVCKDAQGNLWFGTINGLVKYNPRNASVNTLAPNLSFKNITLFYENIANTTYAACLGDWFTQSSPCIFNYNENHLSFEFNGINHRNPENVYYQFMLEGFEDKWSPVTKKNSPTYSNIPPGNYKFKVIAGNEDDVWTEQPLTFEFSVKPPFWQTIWFWGLAIGLSAVLLIAIVYARVKRFKRVEREKRERLKLEKEILEVEQKALRLQMNPHFIFNSMNSVQALILKEDSAGARYYLTKFAKLMRRTLENSRVKFVSIQEEMETLKNYLDLENFGRIEKIEYEFVIDESIDTENVLVPPLLLQPFAENAIIHGFKQLERAPKLKVCFQLIDGLIVASLEDNGMGRKKASKNRSQEEQKHKSAALEVTQERLAILNEDEVHNGFEIVDLYQNEQPSGTKIILRMKLNEEF